MKTRKKTFLLNLFLFLLSPSFLGNQDLYAYANETEDSEEDAHPVQECLKKSGYVYAPSLKEMPSWWRLKGARSEEESNAIEENLSKLEKAADSWVKQLEGAGLGEPQGISLKRVRHLRDALRTLQYGYQFCREGDFDQHPEIRELVLTGHYQKRPSKCQCAFLVNGRYVPSYLIQCLSELLLSKAELNEGEYGKLEAFQILAERCVELQFDFLFLIHSISSSVLWSEMRRSVDLHLLKEEISKKIQSHHRNLKYLLPDRVLERVEKGFQLKLPDPVLKVLPLNALGPEETGPILSALLLGEGAWIVTGEQIARYLPVKKEELGAQGWNYLQEFSLYTHLLLSRALLPTNPPADPESADSDHVAFLPVTVMVFHHLISSLDFQVDSARKEKLWRTCEEVYQKRSKDSLDEEEFPKYHEDLKGQILSTLGSFLEGESEIIDEILSSFYRTKEFSSQLVVRAPLEELSQKLGSLSWMDLFRGLFFNVDNSSDVCKGDCEERKRAVMK